VQTVKPVPPTGGGAEAVATDDVACLAGGCHSVALDGPSEKISYEQSYNQHVDQPYKNN
jgi:hypothetical protein